MVASASYALAIETPHRPQDDVYAKVCSPSQIVMGRETIEVFEQAFDELSEEQRMAIRLRRLAGLPYFEVVPAQLLVPRDHDYLGGGLT